MMAIHTTGSPPRPAALRTPRELLDPALFDQLAAEVAFELGEPLAYAERVIEQTVAFLYACAHRPAAGLTPSPQVDAGWHAFILHTAEYAAFCHRIAARFIHHTPDQPGREGGDDRSTMVERIGRTIEAIRAAGMPVDSQLWLLPSACSQCHAGCYDDPNPTGGQQ